MSRNGIAPLALAAALALGACSSGGSGGGGAGWTGTYMFFEEQGARGAVVAVDPVTLATVEVEPSGVTTFDGSAHHWAGRWNPSTALLDDVHVHAFSYRKRDPASGEDRLYAVDAALGSPLTPRRLSTFSMPPGSVCGEGLYPDHASWDASAIVLETAAPGRCASTTTLMQVRLSAAPTSPPVTYAGGSASIVAAVPSTTGGIAGWLMLRAGVPGLWAEPADWATLATTTVAPDVKVRHLASYPGRVWLLVNGRIEVYAAGAAALADPGGVPAPFPAGGISASDGRHLYFVGPEAGATVQRVRLDGTAAVEQVHALGADSARSLVLSDDRVAYADGAGAWKAFPKAGGAAVPLLSAPGMGNARAFASGSSFYFVDADAITTCAAVDPLGAASVHAAPGRFSVFVPIAGPTGLLDGARVPRRVLLVETDLARGATVLRPHDGATALPLGSVDFPPEYTNTGGVGFPVPSMYGSGGSEHTLIVGTHPDQTNDVLAIDLARPAVRKVTSRSGSYELGCSSGGGAAALSALGLLLALRLPRRRRSPAGR